MSDGVKKATIKLGNFTVYTHMKITASMSIKKMKVTPTEMV